MKINEFTLALLIGLWIWDELSFDHYHNNHDKLARLMTTQTFNGETGTYPNICVPLEKELRTKYTSDYKRLSLTWNSTNILAAGDKKIAQPGIWAQPDLPEMLTMKMNKGSRAAPGEKIFWDMRPGQYQLTCCDNFGRSTTVSFVIH